MSKSVMSEERKEYLREYKRSNLKRIPLEVSLDMYIKILQHVGIRGESVNGFIKRAIEYTMAADDTKTESDKQLDSFREKLLMLNNSKEQTDQ